MTEQTTATQVQRAEPPRPWIAGAVALAAAAVAVCWRVVPHPANLTPVGGLAVFAGARLRLWQALALAFGVTALSDLLLWYVKGTPTWPTAYLGLPAYVLIGRLVAARGSAWRAAAAGVLGSAAFFLVTNFGVWLEGDLYPLTLEGLVTCYWMGIPFYRNTFAADLLFTAALFGAYAWASRPAAAVRPASESP